MKQIGTAALTKEIKNVMNLYSANGWGIFKLTSIDFDKTYATLQAFDNFECSFHQGEGSLSGSEFIRGHLDGLFSAFPRSGH